jgi:CheY-like chemotaxis protein
MALFKSILLVDDDLDDQEIFKTALSEVSQAVTCFTAGNGVDALEKMRNNPALPELILLDVNMPVMDGLETLKEIRNDEKLKQIPVVIYSTTAMPGYIEATKALGASKFIIKPSNYFDLCQLLLSLLDSAKNAHG